MAMPITRSDENIAGCAAESCRVVVLGPRGHRGIAAVEAAARAALARAEVIDAGPLDGDEGRQLGELAAADIAVIVSAAAETFGLAVRRALLLASRLVAGPPLLVIDDEPGSGAFTSGMQKTFADYAARLGFPQAECIASSEGASRLGAALARAGAAGRRGRERAAPLRLLVDAVDTAGSDRLDVRIASGRPKAGDEVIALPSAERRSIATVTPAQEAGPARITLDRPVLPGTQIIAAADARPELADQIAAEVIWSSTAPLLPGRPYAVRLGSTRVAAQVSALKHKLDPADLDPIAARRLAAGEIGLANLSLAAPIAFDAHAANPATGRLIVEDAETGAVIGFANALFALRRASNIHWQALAVDKGMRAGLKGQQPCCLWFTGLSGSGKSTVASLLEKRLAALGRHTYTLDGDNVRHGLNRDLGFTDADRVENIRRVGEVAKLMVDAGLIVLVSFISPFRAERRMARGLLADREFLEIFVDTPIEECERRDPKGLYRKARSGALKNFTGIDSPYEPPESPELRLAAGSLEPEALVEQVLAELRRRGAV